MWLNFKRFWQKKILPTWMISINCDLFQLFCSLRTNWLIMWCKHSSWKTPDLQPMIIVILMLQGQCLHVVRLWCGTGFAMWSAVCHFLFADCLCYCTQNWIKTDGLSLFTTPQVCYEWMIVGVGRIDGGWWRHLAIVMSYSICSWWSLWFERSVLYYDTNCWR